MKRSSLMRLVLPAVCGLVSIAVAGCQPRPPVPETGGDSPSAAGVFARYKQATGGVAWDRVHTLRTQATVEGSGLEGTAASSEDLRTGRYRSEFQLGPISGAEGYDGEVGWSRDESGLVHVPDAPEARETAANSAYHTARGYWYPDRWPGESRLGEVIEDAGSKFQVVHVTPRGGREHALWFDVATGRLARMVQERSNETSTTFFADYRDVGGVWFPHAVRVSNGERAYDQLIAVTSVEINPRVAADHYAKPSKRVADYAFADGRKSITLPFELINNHIYVVASINGQAPVKLLVDTGGVNLLTPQAAKALGIESQGAAQARGAGEKSVDVGFGKVDELVLGPGTEDSVALTDQVFYVLDLGALGSVEGIEFAGLVGFEVFKRFVVTIDYAGRRLTLELPDGYAYQGKGKPVPFVFSHRIPQVKGSIDGVAGPFNIDTGSRAQITLHAPFVTEHGLVARYRPKVDTTTGWGVGGPVRSKVAGGKTLSLGEVAIDDVVVELYTGDKGAFAAKEVAGNIGGGVLRRFTVTFDYAQQIMYLEDNADRDRPDGFDRSGMWINAERDAFVVKDVVKGGPAANAGIRAGDRIVAIDGKPAGELAIYEVRERLRTAAVGTRLRIEFESGGRTRTVKVVLRDLL